MAVFFCLPKVRKIIPGLKASNNNKCLNYDLICLKGRKMKKVNILLMNSLANFQAEGYTDFGFMVSYN